MATTRILLYHSRYLQCYLQIRATIQKTTFFELGVYKLGVVGISNILTGSLSLENEQQCNDSDLDSVLFFLSLYEG